jgi:hypothetical protein
MPFRRQSRFVRIERTEADGVPIFWADLPPPFVATIVFRTGRADETLASAGITHLVEHLAIPIDEPAGVDVNGSVLPTETLFWTAGPRERALVAFQGILRGLGAVDLDRLETERRILLTEAASGASDPVTAAAAFRFGARGFGLPAYEELGLYRVGGEEVEAWWRQRFTAENAAIWMSGRPPGGFQVPLVRGERKEPPPLRPIDGLQLPSHNSGGASGGVCASLIIERSFAANAVLKVAGRRIRKRLRFEHGLSYGAHAVYDALTPGHAHAVLLADCLDDRAAATRDGLMGVLHELAQDGPTDDELRDDAEALEAALGETSETPGFLYGQASEELSGGRVYSAEELVEGRAEVTPVSAAQTLSDAMPSLLLTTPEGTGDVLGGLTRYPLTSPRRVSGREYRLRGLFKGELRKARLIAGDGGVSIIAPDGEALTVFFSACAAVKRWPDGTRGIWGEDGFYVEVAPEHWRGGDEVVRLIDENVPADRVAPMEREVEERAASVDSAAERIKRGWMTSDELKALPGLLGEDERVLAVVEATRGFKAGVAAVTDRRFLFVYFDNVLIDVPHAQITNVRSRDSSLFRTNELTITTSSDEHMLSDIRPKDRLGEFVAALEAARSS